MLPTQCGRSYGTLGGSLGRGSKIQESPTVRVICGILGFAGVAAIAFNAYSEGSIEFDFTLFSSLLGGFLFLYAAFFGALPWGRSSGRGGDKERMSNNKWQMFWDAVVVFLVIATLVISEKGVFEETNLVVLVIVGFMFALVGVALYVYVKDLPEDLG